MCSTRIARTRESRAWLRKRPLSEPQYLSDHAEPWVRARRGYAFERSPLSQAIEQSDCYEMASMQTSQMLSVEKSNERSPCVWSASASQNNSLRSQKAP